MKIKYSNKREAMAISQIFILIISIVAISYAIGSEVGIVRAAVPPTDDKTDTKINQCESTGFECLPINKCNDPIPLMKGCGSGEVCCYQKNSIIKIIDKEDSSNTEIANTNTQTQIDKYRLFKEEQDKQYHEEYNKYIQEKKSTDETTLNFDEWKKQKETTEPEKEKDIMGFKVKEGGFVDILLTSFMWAGIVYTAIKFLGPMLGLEEELVDAASMAAAAGVLIGQASSMLLTKKLGEEKAKIAGAGIGAAVGIVLFIFMYMKKNQQVIKFSCYPWDAPSGGEDCEKCNRGIIPCSEYQCRSLGQGCQLLNPGTNEEKCAWVSKGDVKFPIIEPWKEALLKGYEYKPDGTISPPDRGVRIWNTASAGTGCVKAFTPLSFGVTLNEPAKCKIDVFRKKNFDEMNNFYFSGGLSLYNHSYALSLPGSSALKAENITLGNEGEYRFFVRCQDANGNANTAEFAFSFCVEKGPDTTPPLIVTTNPTSGSPIANKQTSIETTVYTNEPADCRWSHLDQDYEDMKEQMSCSPSIFDMNAQLLYVCDTTLTGLKDKEENKFYFRCKDKAGNANRESYKFSLIGTIPLVIDWAKPENGTVISDSTDPVKVTLEAKTSAGYKEGEAVCYYSDTGVEGSYVMFLNTNSYQHSQDLWLPKGNHQYFIRCIDLGGNSDNEAVNFVVESDSSSPRIIRAYHEETYLKIITDESARCVYDTKYENYPCDYLFDDGTPMKVIEETNHYTDWDDKLTFYIVCQDKYGNQPVPNQCSMIVRPSEIYQAVY